jgi:hypothetical protein
LREIKNAYRFWFGSLKGRVHSEDLGLDGRIILKWNVWKEDVRVGTGFMWFRVGTAGRLLLTR